MDGSNIAMGAAVLVGAVVLIGFLGDPTPKLTPVPPERLAPHTPAEAAVNDYAGSVAAVVYAGHRPLRQAVTRALRAVRKAASHAWQEVRRHRKTGWSVWASRRGATWATASDTRPGYVARHDGTQEMRIVCA